jgi:hypothetical protein
MVAWFITYYCSDFYRTVIAHDPNHRQGNGMGQWICDENKRARSPITMSFSYVVQNTDQT